MGLMDGTFYHDFLPAETEGFFADAFVEHVSGSSVVPECAADCFVAYSEVLGDLFLYSVTDYNSVCAACFCHFCYLFL
jgi:hypothetical protein